MSKKNYIFSKQHRALYMKTYLRTFYCYRANKNCYKIIVV